jgi:hypothetical protein
VECFEELVKEMKAAKQPATPAAPGPSTGKPKQSVRQAIRKRVGGCIVA